MKKPENTSSLLKGIITDSLHYWELRRVPYNIILAVVIVGAITLTWPDSRTLVRFANLAPLFVLAVLANLCYSTAYLADILVQLSDYRSIWQKWRVLLWMVGTLFAAVIAYFWMVDEVIG